MIVGLELIDDPDHGVVDGEDILPGADEFLRGEVGLEDVEGAGDELVI